MPKPTEQLDQACLYFVCEAGDDPPALATLLEAALAGGTDLIQLRDKDADDERLLAAAEAELPWFAIGGIEPGNLAVVIAAGARRVVVVRAIRDADDPESIASSLATALGNIDAVHP